MSQNPCVVSYETAVRDCRRDVIVQCAGGLEKDRRGSINTKMRVSCRLNMGDVVSFIHDAESAMRGSNRHCVTLNNFPYSAGSVLAIRHGAVSYATAYNNEIAFIAESRLLFLRYTLLRNFIATNAFVNVDPFQDGKRGCIFGKGSKIDRNKELHIMD